MLQKYYYLYDTNYVVVEKGIQMEIITKYSSKQPSFYEYFNSIKKYETSPYCYFYSLKKGSNECSYAILFFLFYLYICVQFVILNTPTIIQYALNVIVDDVS